MSPFNITIKRTTENKINLTKTEKNQLLKSAKRSLKAYSEDPCHPMSAVEFRLHLIGNYGSEIVTELCWEGTRES